MADEFLKSAMITFRANKRWADDAIRQLDDELLRQPLDHNTNSICVIMKHVAGNLRSRWTDFLTTDGEKEWRDRDQEFLDDYETIHQAKDDWESGWSTLFATIDSLSENDLSKTVFIRGEPHSVFLAVQRSLGHCSYHVGQIVLIARVLAKDRWNVITIPNKGSRAFNEGNWGSNSFKDRAADNRNQ